MGWNRGMANWLLAMLLLSGIAALFILPVLLTTTILPNPSAVTLPELPAPLDPVADALAVQQLLETTYLGRGKEVPDPGEPAIVLRKYLEQNAHGYHQMLAQDELKLDAELTTWQSLAQLYPQSRHALVALAKYYGTKARVSGNRGYLRQAANAYRKAAEIGLTHGRIRYTRELAGLLVHLGDKDGMDNIFGRVLAQPKDVDRDNYYLALVDYADGLGQLDDDRAWDHFEEAIALHPENNEEAINLYARHLLTHGQPQKAVEVLDTHFTAEHRVSAVVPAFLRKQAVEQAGLETAAAEAEVAAIQQRLTTEPLMGYSRTESSDERTSGLTSTPFLDLSLSTILTPTTAVAQQIPENPVSTVFTINAADNRIWKAQLYPDHSTSAFVFFDAGPAKKLATLRWPNSDPNAPRRAALVRIDTNNVVWYRYFNGASWGAWINLGVPVTGATTVDIAAAARGTSQVDIFVVAIVGTNSRIYHRQSSNNGTNWGSWIDFVCCGTEVALATTPNGTLHFAAQANGSPNNNVWISQFVNNTWVWADLGQPLGGPATDLTLLAYNDTVGLVAVGADQCSLNERHWNGGTPSNWTAWVQYGTSPCTHHVSSFATQESTDVDKSAFLLYIRSNAVLTTHRFNGTVWESAVQQGVMPWLAAAGANFEDDSDPPHEHTVFSDDCRRADQLCYPDPNVPSQCFRAQTLNLAEILYNEARGETKGAQAAVGWTVRDRAYQGLSCDSYPGAQGGALTTNCRNTIPCNDPLFCDSSKRYCCVMHGGTTILGSSQSQFDDEHVPFNTLYNSGFAYRAVHILNGFIPDVSTGFIPSGVSGCNIGCADPFCSLGANSIEASPKGPQEYREDSYLALAPSCKQAPTVNTCQGKANNFVCCNAVGENNYFWNRKP